MDRPSKAAPKRSAGAPKRGLSTPPSSKRAASSGSQPSGGGGGWTDGGRIRLNSRAACFSVALTLAGVFTFLAIFSQHPRTDAFAKLEPRDPRWWVTPLELNATRRLPRVEGDLNAVSGAPGTRQVWMVGEGGLVLHSPDGGETWERQELAAPGKGSAAAPAAARLVPAVDAAETRTLSANPLDTVATLAFLAPRLNPPPQPNNSAREKLPIQQQPPQAQAPATGTGATPKAGATAAPPQAGKASKAAPGTGKKARPAAPAVPSRHPRLARRCLGLAVRSMQAPRTSRKTRRRISMPFSSSMRPMAGSPETAERSSRRSAAGGAGGDRASGASAMPPSRSDLSRSLTPRKAGWSVLGRTGQERSFRSATADGIGMGTSAGNDSS